MGPPSSAASSQRPESAARLLHRVQNLLLKPVNESGICWCPHPQSLESAVRPFSRIWNLPPYTLWQNLEIAYRLYAPSKSDPPLQIMLLCAQFKYNLALYRVQNMKYFSVKL